MFGRFSYQKYKSEPERAPLESQLIAHERLAVPGPGVQLDAHARRDDASTSCSSATRNVKFETIPVDWAGIGDANATIGIPGGQPIPGLSNFNIGDVGSATPASRVQRHQDLSDHREVLAGSRAGIS